MLLTDDASLSYKFFFCCRQPTPMEAESDESESEESDVEVNLEFVTGEEKDPLPSLPDKDKEVSVTKQEQTLIESYELILHWLKSPRARQPVGY